MAWIEDEFDLDLELGRLSKPVLSNGILGRSWDPCEWPGISSTFSAFLVAQGVSATVIDSLGLKMPIPVDPLCTSSPILSLLKPLLHSFLGSDGDMAVDTALGVSAFHPLLTKIQLI
jgi:hypothetical protein